MQWQYDHHASSRSYNNSEFRPDLRNWKEAQLDLSAKPEIFGAWKSRALHVLSDDRSDIRLLLEWAEKQVDPIDAASAQLGAQKAGIGYWEDVQAISMKLLSVLTNMVANSLIPSTQACGSGHGLEFWRTLSARWHGQSQQVLAAMMSSYITPARSPTVLLLWDFLPAWEQKGTQLTLAGEHVSELLRAQALDALVPKEFLHDIISRPELAPYDAKLRYIKQRMHHARGEQQTRGASLHSCAVA